MSRFIFTILSIITCFACVVLHFTGILWIGHTLGDPSNSLPSWLRVMSMILFLKTEIETAALVQVIVIFGWIIVAAGTYFAVFYGLYTLCRTVFRNAVFLHSVKNGFRTQIPLMVLAFFTLAIIPMESHSYEFDTTILQDGMYMPFGVFLLQMNFATLAVFGVGIFLFVVIGFLVLIGPRFFPNAGGGTFFLLVFVGVILGIGVIFFFMMWMTPIIENINAQYGAVKAVVIIPGLQCVFISHGVVSDEERERISRE